MSSSELTKFAKTMGRILFCDDIAPTWIHASSVPPLITKILATTKELKAIPWEYAACPSAPSGPQLANSVVRLVAQARVNPLLPIDRRQGMRVLLLSASPQNLDGIPWPDVRDELLRVFQAALPKIEILTDNQTATSHTYLRIVDAATASTVRRWLRTDNPHVVHFVGHGTDKGLALLNSNTRKCELIDAPAFSAALQNSPAVRLIILSACDTANPKSVDPVDESVGTFAEQIVCNAAPAVIASQMVIDKSTIATFCEGLYPELLRSGSIDLAVAAGRCEVAAQLGKPDSAAIEWGIPVLYRRLSAATLFS